MSYTTYNLERISKRVRHLLTKHEHLREDDNKLIANIWFNEFRDQGLDPDYAPAIKLLRILGDGKLTNPETIRRSRAKIQEEDPSLRGRNYRGRNQEGEETRQDINKIDV